MAHSVCPASRAWMLDNRLRGLLVRPKKIFSPYIETGMTVLDIGCGPGFFTRPIAWLAGETGVIIAADLQKDMLSLLKERAEREGWSTQVSIHETLADSLNLDQPSSVDFAIAFHMVHEVPDPARLFKEVFSLLKPGRLFFVCEPRGHVNKEEFDGEIEDANNAGFIIEKEPKIRMSFGVLLRKPT